MEGGGTTMWGEGGGTAPGIGGCVFSICLEGTTTGEVPPLIGGRCPAVGLHGGRHLLLLAVASGFPNGMIDPTGGPVWGGSGANHSRPVPLQQLNAMMFELIGEIF